MASATLFSLSKFRHTGSWLDRALYAFSVYIVPILIAGGTIATLLLLPRQYQATGAITLPFHVLNEHKASLTPADALARLQDAPSTTRFSTQLSETPIWFTFTAPAMGAAHPTLIEFPSRHAQTLSCWVASSMQPLGHADRQIATGEMRAVKAGFSVYLGFLANPVPLLCRGTFSGPAQLTALAWDSPNLRNSALDFQESSGLIGGGLLTLAVFVFVTAIINREWTYVIFAVWLVGNLRLCANAMGWDTQWLDRVIPPDWMPLLRQVTFAAYYLLTGALFSQLFRRELRSIGYRWLLRAGQYVGLVLLALALVLPYSRFIPALWGLGGFGIGVLIFLLARLVWLARSRTVLWYVASLGIVLFATFSEVLGAAFGLKLLFGGVNTVMAALSSSMMAAFAIAEQMRAEREHRRQAQTELRNTYEVTPIGLFTLDSNGHFVRANPALRAMLDLHKSDYKARHWNDYFEAGAWGALQALASKGSDGELEMGGALARGTAERRYLLKAIRSNGWIEGSLQDVTERSKAIERLRFLAEHDPLTASLNRRGVEKAIAAESEETLPWALAYVDLDRFKLVNDLFGHRAGDEVLKQVASRMRAHFERGYAVGRIGGDEFVCVMSDTSIDDAIAQCHELIALLSRRAVSGRQSRVPGEGVDRAGRMLARRARAGCAVARRPRMSRGEEGRAYAARHVPQGRGRIRGARGGTAARRDARPQPAAGGALPRDAADHVAFGADRVAEFRGAAAHARARRLDAARRQGDRRGGGIGQHRGDRPLGHDDAARMDREASGVAAEHAVHLRESLRRVAQRRAVHGGHLRAVRAIPVDRALPVPRNHRERRAARS